MIVLKAEAGLCNRLRAISSAIRIAKETGHELVVVWETDRAMNAKFSDLFQTTVPFRLYEINVPQNHYILSAIARIKRLLIRKWTSWIFLPGEERCFVEWCRSNRNSRTCFLQTFYEFSADREYSWLKPRFDVQEEIDSLSNLSKGKIGVHIRRTDNRSAMRNSPVELFYERIKNDCSEHNGVQFFVATDDNNVKAELKANFGIAISTRNNVAARSEKRGVRDAVIDLWLLATSKRLYGSKTSTFSEEAARIGKIEVEWIVKQ